MGCYRFFCQPKITHSGPMCSRQITLSGHFTWASSNNNHITPSSSISRPPEQLPWKETLNPVHWILRLTANHYQSDSSCSNCFLCQVLALAVASLLRTAPFSCVCPPGNAPLY